MNVILLSHLGLGDNIQYMVIELIPNVVDEFELYTSIDKYNWIIKKTLPSSPSPRKWIVCEKNVKVET